MATEFTRNISMLVPQSKWAIAGDLVAVISGQRADRQHFTAPVFQPDYAACNQSVKPSHVQALMAAKAGQYTPQRPEFDANAEIDMAAVLSAIAGASVVTSIPEGGLTPVPDAIIFGVDIDAATLAAACGLGRVQDNP